MAEHTYELEGGYFWKKSPQLAMPAQTDLWGQPLAGSMRTIEQLHGQFMSKECNKGKFIVLLRITGRATITDDVLGETESRELESYLRITVTATMYQYPFVVGKNYLLSTVSIRPI